MRNDATEDSANRVVAKLVDKIVARLNYC